MKSNRSILLAGLSALLLTAPWLHAADPVAAKSGEKLYVSITSPELIAFDRLRRALTNGDELILSTLKSSAAEQARFAGYPGEVVVLDDDKKAPAGAPVLLLNWADGSVTATLIKSGHEKYLGVVSRTPLSIHPDYANMRADMDHGLNDARRDAHLRAATKMDLYQALIYLRSEQTNT